MSHPGSIELLPSGNVRVRVLIDGKRRQVGRVYKTEAEAKRMLRAWNAERDAGGIEAPAALTLGAFGETWLDGREISGSRLRERVRSIGVERSVWGRHVATSDLAAMPLASIRPRDIEDFSRWLRERPAVSTIVRGTGSTRTKETRNLGRTISRSMQTNALRLVRGALDEAVRHEFIERNPAEKARIARGSAAPRDLSDQWLRAPEIDRLLACEEISLRDRTAFACAIGLGLRLGDLKHLEVSRVFLDTDVPGPHVLVDISKSAKWHRVPVMPWLMPWLRAHLASLPKKARFLFPATNGRPYCKSHDFGWGVTIERRQVGRGEARKLATVRTPGALERAGVTRRIRFHDLRGTTATHLALGSWGRTWSLHEIQSMLAHSDQRVTERYVRRVIDTLSDAARNTRKGPGSSDARAVEETLPTSCPRDPQVPVNTEESSAFLSERSQVRFPAGASMIPGTYDDVPDPSVGKRGQESDAQEHAKRVIETLASGRTDRSAIEGLADAVLNDERVRLALEVREGGPHAVRRAIELAALILADAGEARGRLGAG